MSSGLKIWGRPSSFNVQKVRWLAGELQLAPELIPTGGEFGGLDSPAFRSLNPNGLVPVLQDGDLTVWESHAIMRYLAGQYGQEAFWPAAAAGRAHIDQWMDWAQTTLAPAFLGGVFWGCYRTPPAQRDQPAIDKSLDRSAHLLGLLEQMLAGRSFLLGEHLTLADIPAGAMLYRYFELDIARPSLPNVQAWYGRLKQRPAYQAHVMVSFAELEGRLDF